MNLFGQWTGLFTGSIPGEATLSVEKGSESSAFVTIVQNFPETNIPPLTLRFDVEFQIDQHEFRATSKSTRVFDRELNTLVPIDSFKKLPSKELYLNQSIRVEGKLSPDFTFIKGKWTSEKQEQGDFELINPKIIPVKNADQVMTWEDFKNHVSYLIQNKQSRIFRGQTSNHWKLQTSFHRYGRYDLAQYYQKDIPILADRIIAFSGHSYDISDPRQLGNLLSLAQHHGYPTPLLDWTLSPYVAAYFAFESRPKEGPVDGFFRIFELDADRWQRETHQTVSLNDPHPSLSIKQFSAFNNPRHMPQQSVHTFSNVDDIESWISTSEAAQRPQCKYLTVIDIPYSEREKGMKDLAYMGMTAATLFPGVEGLCRATKEEFFTW
jgi:hypothetical protein